MSNDLDIPDLDFEIGPAGDMLQFGEEAITETENQTSDKYAKEAKTFLESMRIFNTENIKKSTYKYIHDKNAIPLPEPGEQIRIRTQQQMNLIVVILRILEEHKAIDELTIATYTLNREAMSILTQLKEAGKIKKINFFISSSYGFRDSGWKDEIEKICKAAGVGLTFAWSHFKITLVKAAGNFYQFEGSMNYSTNNMAEQLLFENNETTYREDYEFITQVMKDRGNKALEVVC